MNELNEFKEYVEEQRHLCYGVEGGTPGVHGRIARQYDFLLETIDTYQEIEQKKRRERMAEFDTLGARQEPQDEARAVATDWKGDPLYKGDTVYTTDLGLVHEDQIIDYVNENYRKINIGGF